MRKMQNVLYVMSHGSKLSVKNKSVCVTYNSNETHTIPVHNIETIVCFGNLTLTSAFMDFCAYNGVKLCLLSESGRYCGAFYGHQRGNIFLRTNQYRIFDDREISMDISKKIIETKVRNTIRFLGKSTANKSPENSFAIRNAIDKISSYKEKIYSVDTPEELRAYEGLAASAYFGAVDNMLVNNDDGMKFEKRTRRPPENNMNALMSFLYTLLEIDVTAALECVGLDIQKGIFHTMNYNKPSLALDIMEEFRVGMCDKIAISMVNKRQLTSENFENDGDMIKLTREARKLVINEWQKRKKRMIYHPVLKEKIPEGLLPFAQAQIMSSYLRGESEEYVPFLWR